MRAARATNSSTASPTQSTPPAPAPGAAASTRRSSRACAPWPACSSPNATAAASTSASAHMLDIMADTDLSHTHNDSADTPDLSRMSCSGNVGWAVVHTRSQAERWCAANLERVGYRVYLPLYAALVRDPVLHTRTLTALRPLFERYLFVHHDSPGFWRPIREAPGVASVL